MGSIPYHSLLQGSMGWHERMVPMPPAYTLQDCSGGDERVPKSLSMRMSGGGATCATS
jgi:hypothetical protein